MTEWVLVVTLLYATGYDMPEMPNQMEWVMPNHRACVVARDRLFPKAAGNQIQIAYCVERDVAEEGE